MPFADGPKAQYESASSRGCAGLVGVPHDARVEQGRGFERVLVQEIRTDQMPLCFRQNGMRLQCRLHLDGTHFEGLEQVPMPTFEVFEYVGQLLLSGVGVEAQNSSDYVIGARLVGERAQGGR